MILKCISWNTKNMLKSNPNKTEIPHFTSRFSKQPAFCEAVDLSNTTVKAKTKASNLGVIMDRTLSFSDHIKKTCKKASGVIRSIGRIRKYLPQNGLKRLVNSLVISRLDFCNCLLIIWCSKLSKSQSTKDPKCIISVGNRYTHH